jgi:hypothetical protein
MSVAYVPHGSTKEERKTDYQKVDMQFCKDWEAQQAASSPPQKRPNLRPLEAEMRRPKPRKSLIDSCVRELQKLSWTGNIRELEHAIFYSRNFIFLSTRLME